MPPLISIIHPSRGRPQQAFETAKRWLDMAGTKVEYILSLDTSDIYQKSYFEKFGFGGDDWPDKIGVHKTKSGYYCVLSDNKSAVDAINNAAEISTGDILIQISDDFDCPDNWGLKIIEATSSQTDWILKTQDGIQNWIITLPVMDRAYYNRFGYIYHPGYKHMFCDTELSCVADLTGRRITSDLIFKHNHYSVLKTSPDEVGRRADATWADGERFFIERCKSNFNLINPPGKITDQGYLNWIKQRL